MIDRKELENAVERLKDVLDLSIFSPETSAAVITSSLKKQLSDRGTAFTEEEISAFVKELNISPAMDEEREHQLNEAFEKAISNILTGMYDEFTQQQVISGMMARVQVGHLNISEDEIKKFVKAKFKELTHVSDLSPYRMK